jgi:hypothetical protein
VSRIRAGFFSLTSGAVSGDDASYLRWHLLDHLPEQYSIPGIRLGTRWQADDGCVALRAADTADLAPVRHAVCYLMTDPVEDTLLAFARLGRALAEAGRYPEPATPHLLGAYEVHGAYTAPAARVSAGVIPFRPHRGVYLTIEQPTTPDALADWWSWHESEHVPALLATEGVSGVYAFRTTARLGAGADQGRRFGTALWDPGGALVTVVYLDRDVVETTSRLDPIVRARWEEGSVTPRLAGPFRSPVAYEAWPPGP